MSPLLYRLLENPNPAAPEPEKVQKLFDGIAKGYDRFNSIASLGLDRLWRRDICRTIRLGGLGGNVLLDLGTGTGGLLFDLIKEGNSSFETRLVGIDFSYPMLEAAKEKIPCAQVLLLQGNLENLPFKEHSVSIIMNAFVLRNVKKIASQALREIFRVLESGGKAYFLEMYAPQNHGLKFIHKIYLKTFLPIIGRLVLGRGWPGGYLSETIFNFGRPEEFSQKLNEVGFKQVECKLLHGGIAALHSAKK